MGSPRQCWAELALEPQTCLRLCETRLHGMNSPWLRVLTQIRMSFSEAWRECGGDLTCASPED